MRIAIFFIFLILFMLLQHFFTKREYRFQLERVVGNIALSSCFNIILKFGFLFSIYSFTTTGASFVVIALQIIFLDFCIYLQHVASHRFNLLWKIHKVHHSDLDLETTTALRFHPLELLLSYLYKGAIVFFFKIDFHAFLIFEILLNSMAMFNHSNIKIPAKVDRLLQWILVTPDMHRIHHFKQHTYHNSNYGFNLSLWDRIFKTYSWMDFKAQERFEIGLNKERADNFWQMLIMPFK